MRAAILCLGLLTACGDKADGETNEHTGIEETGDTGGETGLPVDTADPYLAFNLTILDFESRDEIIGAVFSLPGGASATTDEDGLATLNLAWDTRTTATAPLDAYPDLAVIFDVDTTWSGYNQRQYVPTASTFGTTLDPTKGHIILDIYEIGIAEGGGPDTSELAGVGVAIDQSAGSTMVTSYASASGLVDGNETIGGGGRGSSAYFLNVAPGTATVTVTPPAGLSCNRGPGTDSTTDWTVDVVADTSSRVMVLCR